MKTTARIERSMAIGALLLAAALVSGCERGAGGKAAGSTGRRPDIVLISIDSLRPDHLGAYGYQRPTSPRIDALARDGVRFQNAVSSTSWTLPAHASLFTGLNAGAHGLVDNGLRLADAQVTLAEALRDAGYQTAGFFGGPYLHPAFGLDQGFQTYKSCMTTIADDIDDKDLRREASSVKDPSHSDITGPRTVKRVHAWLDTIGEAPFFLFIHLWDVHYDYIPPEEFASRFDPDYTGTVDGLDLMANPGINASMPARDLFHLVALYDGEIAFTDQILGSILDDLAAHHRFDSSLVVVTADHGEEFFEHSGKGHQRTLFDEVVRVPLIVRWGDRLPRGAVVSDQVRLVDLMPTMLGVAGLPLPHEVSGRDVSPLLFGKPLAEAPALCQLQVNGRDDRALRTNREKFVVDATSAGLYDLAGDPRELHRLPAGSPGFSEAQASLDNVMNATRTLGRAAPAEGIETPNIDPEVVRRLKSLGYVGGTP